MVNIKEKFALFYFLFLFFISLFFSLKAGGEEIPNELLKILFTIHGFQVDGNTLLLPEKIKELISPFEGEKREMGDVEKARAILEKTYHEAGYPAVLVAVPEQTLENGIVKMSVIESRLGKVEVSGNHYFSTQRILNKLPSLRSGAILYEPEVVKEMNQVNSNPDLVVTPVLAMGSEPGTVDLQLEAKDHLPLHGSLELNNRSSPNTPQYRLNGMIQYTNLYDRDQTLTLNTTQSPDEWGQIQLYGLSYAAPLNDPEHLLVGYAVKSVSKSVLNGSSLSTPGEVNLLGNTTILGLRYLFPLGEPNPALTRQLSVGIEYKQQGENNATFPDGTTFPSSDPVNYLPVSMTYTGTKVDSFGSLKVTLTVKGNQAGMVPGGGKSDFGRYPTDPLNPYILHGNRAGSTGTFAVFQAGSEFLRVLPKGFDFWLKWEGQMASEPLISAEQFFGGGVDSVRGYMENEALGDNALRGSLELVSPPLPAILPGKFQENIRFSIFLDAAELLLLEAPQGQADHYDLAGTGIGARFKLTDTFQAALDQAWALQSGVVTQKGDHFTHFSLKVIF